jgi:beta-glucosidase
VTVKNTGRRAGREVVQLYIREQKPEVPRPEKELKAFAKILLNPGESKKVVFNLPESSFGFWDRVTHSRRVAPGLYDVMAGSSSRHLPLLKAVKLKGDQPKALPLTEESMLKEVARHPKGKAYYKQLVQATGLAGAIGKNSKKSLTVREKADIEKARKALMAFVNELPLNRIGGFSVGKFKDEQLKKILKKIK